MPEAIWLAASFAASGVGMGWLALALDPHWQQVNGPAPLPRPTRRLLRAAGSAALAFSLIACFLADHPSMAPLVWIMGLTVGALAVALVLAWRPRFLAILYRAPRSASTL